MNPMERLGLVPTDTARLARQVRYEAFVAAISREFGFRGTASNTIWTLLRFQEISTAGKATDFIEVGGAV